MAYKPRYEITGEWSGYRSSQRRVVHREYTTNKEFADKVKQLGFIRFTDGTTLDLTVREMKKGERRQSEILAYWELIRECIAKGKRSVSELD